MSNTSDPHHTCQAVVISCMDFRLQEMIHKWAVKNIKDGFDRVALAGGVKNLDFVLSQIELSVKLHGIKEAYLINHEDCGAYGKEGTFEKHKKNLLFAKKTLARKFPTLKIAPLYLKLNGEFVEIT